MLCEDKGSGASPSRLAITDAASTPPLRNRYEKVIGIVKRAVQETLPT